ncbi:putative pterin-binding protein [Roseivivax sp. CAU 1753]
MMKRAISRAAVALTATVAMALTASAQPLPQPTGPVVLTVTGDIAHTNRGDTAVFDLAMLEALGKRTIWTSTIWTDGKIAFAGLSLDVLIDRLGITGDTIVARALNDYAVEIPTSDATPDGPIIAYEKNGRFIPRREQGPLWIIYPYDSAPEYRTEVIHSRSVWQMVRIEVPE